MYPMVRPPPHPPRFNPYGCILVGGAGPGTKLKETEGVILSEIRGSEQFLAMWRDIWAW